MIHVVTDIKNPSDKDLIQNEWLETNGLGGFACGTISNIFTRKYHSLLTAALHAPFGRTIMLNHVEDSIIGPTGEEVILTFQLKNSCEQLPNIKLVEFKLRDGVPFWIYQHNDIVIEKRLHLVNRQNTVHITYRILSGPKPLLLKWRPYLHFRNYEMPVNCPIPNEQYAIHSHDNHYEIDCPGFPLLRISNTFNKPFFPDYQEMEKIYYQLEEKRGYDSLGRLTSPGYFIVELSEQNDEVTFIASTESWEVIEMLSHRDAWYAEKLRRRNILKSAGLLVGRSQPVSNETLGKLVLAADQFIFTPTTRFKDVIRLLAAGDEPGSIIAGFPWFTDWGRDTMISLEGLTLTTGRWQLAYSILMTFSHYLNHGLIPNMFPDRENEARYNTADATMWFFHAVDRYIQITNDHHILDLLLPKFKEIINSHLQGTLFGIHIDEDGLLTQGAEGLQLTWMDAKVGDWVVTPRRGKAVEINALWYNAIKLMHEWTGDYGELSEKIYESFNRRFWYEQGQYLYDVVDAIDSKTPNDDALRPNQLFAISLKYPVLVHEKWRSVLEKVKDHLLTPFGLRTLSPQHPDFHPNYDGDLRSRDAAYHQGTVWPWLLGPFIDTWLKVFPNEVEKAKEFLKGLEEHLNHTCVGNIAEIFDAVEPFHARGCFAQAWSVAEYLRCLKKLS